MKQLHYLMTNCFLCNSNLTPNILGPHNCYNCNKFGVWKHSTETVFNFYLNSGIYRILQDYYRINERCFLVNELNKIIFEFDEIFIPNNFEDMKILEDKINKLLTFQ